MAAAKVELEKLFAMMAKSGASDMHLKVGSPPVFRVNKRLGSLDVPPLSDERVWELISSIMSERQLKRFEQSNNSEFAYSIAGVGRYRVTVLRQRGCVTVVVRRVSYDIPTFDDLNLPEAMRGIARFDQGLCIVAGPTGSGKSTTLASLLNEINTSRRCHILTVEDPIEYLYRDIKGLVKRCATPSRSRSPSRPPRPGTWFLGRSTSPRPRSLSAASSTSFRRSGTCRSGTCSPST